MRKLSTMFLESKADTLALMPKYFDEVMDKYLKKYMVNVKYFLSTPSFVVRSARGMHAWYSERHGEIGINTDDALHGDEKLIKSLVYHEAIHYVQSSIGEDRRDSHGPFFQKCMREINAGEGYECVKIKEEAVDYDTQKPYRVVGFVTPGGDYYFGRSPKLSNYYDDLASIMNLAKRYKSDKVFSFMCTLGFFFKSIPSISGKSGSYVQFNETDRNREKLAELIKLADSNLIPASQSN